MQKAPNWSVFFMPPGMPAHVTAFAIAAACTAASCSAWATSSSSGMARISFWCSSASWLTADTATTPITAWHAADTAMMMPASEAYSGDSAFLSSMAPAAQVGRMRK